MATQEERLMTLEESLATFQRETILIIREINQNSTILLGLFYKQRIEIKDIQERLGLLEQDVHEVKSTLNEHTTLLNEHTIRFDRMEDMLTQILERVSK